MNGRARSSSPAFRICLWGAALCLLLLAMLAPPAQAVLMERVSVRSDGTQGNGSCPTGYRSPTSSDGRYVVFASTSSNLVPNDTNAAPDIFRRDRSTGATVLVSVGLDGKPGAGPSLQPDISANGQFVVFHSLAANLVSDDSNGRYDVFMRDMDKGKTIRLSVATGGAQGNGDSSGARISPEGRYVVFVSGATNLVAGDTNSATDIFLHDTMNSETTRVSVGAGGQANGLSDRGAVSSDAQHIVFSSAATNLVAGDSNGRTDIFVRDRDDSTTTRVNVSTEGAQALLGNSAGPEVSYDGRYVAFDSEASNLVSGDTNGVSDVFVRDCVSNTTVRASVSSSEVQGTSASGSAGISNDGRWVVFRSLSANLVSGDSNGMNDIFLRDLTAGTTMRMSVPDAGGEANAASTDPCLSGDGRFVTFVSAAGNLVPGDTNGVPDVFACKRSSYQPDGMVRKAGAASYVGDNQYMVNQTATQTIPLPGVAIYQVKMENDGVLSSVLTLTGSASTTGWSVKYFDALTDGNNITTKVTGAGWSSPLLAPGESVEVRFEVMPNYAVSSGSWREVVLTVTATADPSMYDSGLRAITNVFHGTTEVVSVNDAGTLGNQVSTSASISQDGRYVAFASTASNLSPDDTNGNTQDIFVHDRQTHTTRLVSRGWDGAGANASSGSPVISADGKFVAFCSPASNLVADDSNGNYDIFVHNLETGETVRASVATGGAEVMGASMGPAISADGRYVAFDSTATTLVNGDTNGQSDVFVHDMTLGSTVRVSYSPLFGEAMGASNRAAISGDGKVVAFTSTAANLVPNDTNGRADVFAYDFVKGGLRRVSEGTGGIAGNGDSYTGEVSTDGRYVVFNTMATNLVPGDTNGAYDVLVNEWQTGRTTAISVSLAGIAGNGSSWGHAISGDGRYVAFESTASNLGSSAGAAAYDIFLRDTVISTTWYLSVSSSGQGATADSHRPAISSDGRYVAFDSAAGNLVPGDTNGCNDVFVRAWMQYQPDVTVRKVGATDAAGDGEYSGGSGQLSPVALMVGHTVVAMVRVQNDANHPDRFQITGGGGGGGWTVRYLDVASGADVTAQVVAGFSTDVLQPGGYLELQMEVTADAALTPGSSYQAAVTASSLTEAGAQDAAGLELTATEVLHTMRVSVSSGGVQGNASSAVKLSSSADGRYVAFPSLASTLVDGDTNNSCDVFVHDRQTGLTERVSVNASGVQGNGSSVDARISGDGRFVAFYSAATNLVADDTDGVMDVYVFDRQTRTVTRASLGPGNAQPNQQCGQPAISEDGRYVAFLTAANTLLPEDTNSIEDIYRFDMQTGGLERVSVNSDNVGAEAGCVLPSLSGDGRFVAFHSAATNLVADDTNHKTDIFVHDCVGGATTRVSVSSSGAEADGASDNAMISADGRWVVFQSAATNLVPDVIPGVNTFLHDRQTGQTSLVNVSSYGKPGPNTINTSYISDDGRFMVFCSIGSLVPEDTNGQNDVYLRDTAAGTTTRVSLAYDDAQSNNSQQYYPAISGDGRAVVFASVATNLVPGDTNGVQDVFAREITPAVITHPPVAADDTATTPEDQSVVVEVLANDSDPDSDPLTVTATGTPSHGQATANGDGTVTYAPAADYNGPDSFTYTISDGTATATASVNVTVTPVNDPPVANDDRATTQEDTAVVVDVLANDTDVDGDPLSIQGVSEPAHGTATIESGQVSYQPAANYYGDDSFTYTISDGSATDTATVAITVTAVNDPPAAADDEVTTCRDTPVAIPVLANDTDPEADVLTVGAVSQPSHGQAAINPDGTITYTPTADYVGADSFTYTAADGAGGQDTAAVSVMVLRPWVIDAGDAEAGRGRTATVLVSLIPKADTAGMNACEANLRTLGLAVAMYQTDNEERFPPATNPAELLACLLDYAGDPSVFNCPVSGRPYLPNPALAGKRSSDVPDPSATAMIWDELPHADGSRCTVYADGHVEAQGVPEGVASLQFDLRYNLGRAGLLTVSAMRKGAALPDDWTLNHTIPEAGVVRITASSATELPVDASGVVAEVDFTVDSGASVDESCGLRPADISLRDGSGNPLLPVAGTDGTFSVIHVNEAPVLDEIGTKTVAENAALSFAISGSDPDGDPLTYSTGVLPAGAAFDAATATFSWTPGYDQAGSHQVTFTVSDGSLSDSEEVTITVTNVNRPPELAAIGAQTVAENAALSFAISGSDPDGDPLTYSTGVLPAGAAFDAATATFSWTPGYEQAGSHQVTFSVSDGTASDSETITITVTNVNRPPELAAIGAKTTAENAALSFAISGSDPDGDPLTYSTGVLPAGAAFDAATATFSWTPGYDQAGSHQVTFTVSDGTASDSETITITVTNVNRPPVLASPGDKTATEQQALTFTLSASDPDSDTITYASDNLPTGAQLNSSTGAFSWTPSVGQAGTHQVMFTASDGGLADSKTINIVVAAGGNTPTGSNVTLDLGSGVTITFAQVTQSGTTSLQTSTDPPLQAPQGWKFMHTYFDITTTAQYVGPITITIAYHPADVQGNESQLKIFHAGGTGWDKVTVSVDTVNHVITAQVNSLSWFGMGWPEYKWLGFLPPLEGADRPFKQKSTIPVKFRISNAAGQPVTNAQAYLAVYYLVAGAPEGEPEVVSTSAGDSGNMFRYSPTDDLYIFNLSTKSSGFRAPFTYRALVRLDDGNSYSIDFGLK